MCQVSLVVKYQMGLVARKPVFGGLRTTQEQTSQRIRVVWSAPLFFCILESVKCKLVRGEISIIYIVSVADETCLKLALSETQSQFFRDEAHIVEHYKYKPVLRDFGSCHNCE